MKPKRGLWYWLSLTNLGLLFGSRHGAFGAEAQDEANTALDDIRPAAPLLAIIGLALITVLVLAGLYLVLR